MPPAASPPRVEVEEGELNPVLPVVDLRSEESDVEMLNGLKVVEDGRFTDVSSGLDLENVKDTQTHDGEKVMDDGSQEKCLGKVPETQLVAGGEPMEKISPQASWVSVAKNGLEKPSVELEVEEIDGMLTARIPNSVFDEAQPLWEDFLVGKFLAKAPFVGGIHALVNKIWTLGDRTMRIDVIVVDNTTVRFRIKDARTRARVLRRGMWNLCGVPVILSKWSPIVDTKQEEMKTIPLWVIVKNVPPKYFSWKVLSAITSPLGTPKKLHPDTEACKSFEEAKVFVEVDLTKKLPKFFSFKSEKGGDTIVEFVYPWLPPRCTNCSKWGHLGSDCLAGKKTEQKVESTDKAELPVIEEMENKTEENRVVEAVQNNEDAEVTERKADRIVQSVFHDWSFMSNYEEHRLGRLWLVWRHNVRVTPLFKTAQLITVSIYIEGRREEFFVTFVYASNHVAERKLLWDDIIAHHDSPLFHGKAWLICGDFNEVLEGEDHSLYEVSPTISPGMRDFQNLASHCELTDLSYQGERFTWCNKRHDGVICKKLDRVLVSKQWIQQYDQSYSVFESGGCSDHLRCRFYIKEADRKTKRPFKFTNLLTTISGYQQEVEAQWLTSPPLFHSTSAMYRLSKKLKDLKPTIRQMGKKLLGDISIRTKAAYRSLCALQEVTMANPTSQSVDAETEAYEKWKRLAEIEEGYLKQKSKLHWMETGDQNNKAFYNAAKLREIRNNIKEIHCADGSIVSDQDGIKAEAERHFKDFLTITPHDYEEWSSIELENILNFKCDVDDKSMLEAEVSAEEVKKILFKMPATKSPGPDGYTCEFFKETWSTVGNDFVVAIQSFFKTGFLPKGVNSTILALIPKKTEATAMKDYRPISCCNVLYKVITKILANRLKTILPKFISPNQSAFIKDRLLMENLLLATEIIKDYHKESISPRCAMKIDISKAFDSVQWGFLLNTLQALGFPDKYIHWIKVCITTPSFSVQVNGELAGYFGSKRGLRQGCPLSPYLFVICMNVLSHMIDKAAQNKSFEYHPNCKHMNLTHLCFADDLMIFVKGNKKSVESVLKVFDEFATHSGLKISLEKSTLYMAGVSTTQKDEILQQFPFEYGSLPVRYLGLPLLTKKMTTADYLPLIERIRSQIQSWTARALSFAGRLQLIGSVIFSLTNFWIAAFRLPKDCIREIDKLCSAFLWSGPSLNPRKTKVAWSDVCSPKSEGGLGLRSIEEANKICVLKLIWRILTRKNSLWVNWVKRYLVRKDSFWAVKEKTTSGSWIWRKLLKYRELAQRFYKVEVKNGKSTSFWYDDWSPLGCLHGKLGERGCIDLGIPRTSTVGEVMSMRRGKKHRAAYLNLVEAEIRKHKHVWKEGEQDVALWLGTNDNYRKTFSTKETWSNIRRTKPVMEEYKGIWFSYHTPKYSFLTWLVAKNRLSTGDRMIKWNIQANTKCMLCQEPMETRDHLFFKCPYALKVWTELAKGILKEKFSANWREVLKLTSDTNLDKTHAFILRYVLQNTIHSIWQERNTRRHGDQPSPEEKLVKMIDKNVRNRLSTIRSGGDTRHATGIQVWFATRNLHD
ncbi:Reverse transcriptase zinc-binding domain [Arabidopsis thaliana x Arabidopsis arenosa]|uniref:Reverse transcriptase zinc-binding domain n=1 Tax=Arabidopsis thaliana x Arabidopsis arenosa TaxID=1240361 RepID=A0A8T1Y8Y4_9BRAS|nr:Reverse transcriptase zinc-binding domain [Arabidopsis thaliana x Arabidopsis arenosa]